MINRLLCIKQGVRRIGYPRRAGKTLGESTDLLKNGGRGSGGLSLGGVREELAEFRKQIFLVLKKLGDATVDFRLGQREARSNALLQITLLLQEEKDKGARFSN